MTAAVPYNRSSAAAATSSPARATTARGSSTDGAAVHIARLINGARQHLQVQFVSDARSRLLKVTDEGVHDGDLTFPFGPAIVGDGPAAGHMMAAAAARAASTASAAGAFLLAAGIVSVEHGWKGEWVVASMIDGFVDKIGIFEGFCGHKSSRAA